VRRALVGVVAAAVVAALTACSAPSDDDGEVLHAGSLAAAPPKAASATPTVVDTDLGADDVVALAFLLRHPQVRVEAITIAGTGLVRCRAGVDVLADLLTALELDAVPVACGRERRGPVGRPFPTTWRYAAEAGSGLPRDPGGLQPADRPAPALIADLAGATPRLHVVALGPLTNLADLADQDPAAFGALAAITAMTGVVDGPAQGPVAEWNAAADPEALDAVLTAAHDAASPTLTLVPADAMPTGTPAALSAPVVGSVVLRSQLPAWWDLAAAGAAVLPEALTVTSGRYEQDAAEPGRLRRAGEGRVDVVRSMDAAALDAAYAGSFRSSPARS
jgi:hypothetical protein